FERVAKRPAEGRGFDFKAIAQPCFDTRRAAQDRRAEKIRMQVARTSKHAVAEMVVLKIADGVRHVVVTAEERLLPQYLAIAHEPRPSLDASGQLAQEQLRTERARPQLGMGKV